MEDVKTNVQAGSEHLQQFLLSFRAATAVSAAYKLHLICLLIWLIIIRRSTIFPSAHCHSPGAIFSPIFLFLFKSKSIEKFRELAKHQLLPVTELLKPQAAVARMFPLWCYVESHHLLCVSSISNSALDLRALVKHKARNASH